MTCSWISLFRHLLRLVSQLECSDRAGGGEDEEGDGQGLAQSQGGERPDEPRKAEGKTGGAKGEGEEADPKTREAKMSLCLLYIVFAISLNLCPTMTVL